MNKKKFTQQQVEDFILLAGQSKKRWFELRFLDEDMNNDPTAKALMEAIADSIHDGLMSLQFLDVGEPEIARPN